MRMPVYVYGFWPRCHQEAQLQQRELVLTSEAGDCRLEFGWLLFWYYLISFLSLWLFFVVLELYRTRDAGCIVSPLPPIDLGKMAHSV